ncbi:hypothetical protein ACHAWF_011824, partial [Thalassiosira exigua]
ISPSTIHASRRTDSCHFHFHPSSFTSHLTPPPPTIHSAYLLLPLLLLFVFGSASDGRRRRRLVHGPRRGEGGDWRLAAGCVDSTTDPETDRSVPKMWCPLACLLLLARADAFRLPYSPPLRTRHPSTTAAPNEDAARVDARSSSATSATALGGKLWKRLQIDEDDPSDDGTSWYLINCVAGVELDLLNQCRHVCEDFPPDLVEKFVVPTERHLRSHGDKRKVVDVKVRYPGYVFCKICLVEDVYERLQELELARSWMGTVNRKGHKKLPPAPLPLSDEEVKRFKGLEEAQEMFEDMWGGDYTGRNDTGADLLAQYAGYDVGQMVKVLRGNFEGEDGTVRRLKDGQLMVRMFTYGQTYDEWFDPDAIRPLTDLEVMRGLSGPTKPINQDQFDVSIGKKDPSILEDESSGGDPVRTGTLRSGLLQDAGQGGQRNRREDRVARGETGRQDMFGRTPEGVKREEENWLAYREERRASQRGGGEVNTNAYARQAEANKKKAKGPPKGQDTWGIVERSSWNGGEYGFEADSEREEQDRRQRTAEVYKDRAPRGRNVRDGRGRSGDRRDERSDRRPVRQARNGYERDSGQDSLFETDQGKEGDFFDSLMSDLNDDLDRGGHGGEAGARGARRHDDAGPNARTAGEGRDAEDSFFDDLMSELGGALDAPPPSPSEKAKSERKLNDDDFFSNLEAELTQSLGGNFGGDSESGADKSSDDDFFASLQNVYDKALDKSPAGDDFDSDNGSEDDFFASLQQVLDQPPQEKSQTIQSDDDVSQQKADESLHDDFFSRLMDDVADELDSISTATGSEDPSLSHADHDAGSESLEYSTSKLQTDLSSLTVSELKGLLRSRGLKVGGKKAELIDRLQSSAVE